MSQLMERRIVFSDIDGTFLNSDHEITDKVKEVYSRLIKDGVIIIPTTGRNHISCVGVVTRQSAQTPSTASHTTSSSKEEGRDDESSPSVSTLSESSSTSEGTPRNKRVFEFQSTPGIYLNGAVCFGTNGIDDVIYEIGIDPTLAESLDKIIQEEMSDDLNEAVLMYYHKDSIFIGYDSDFCFEFCNQWHEIRPTFIDGDVPNFMRSQKKTIHKLQFVGTELNCQKLFPKFQDWGREHHLRPLHTAIGCIEFVRSDTSKMTAIKKLCEYFQYPLNQIVTIGDGNNDVEMLREAPISYAMGNASQHVKSSAKKTLTKTNDEDGWVEAMIDVFGPMICMHQ